MLGLRWFLSTAVLAIGSFGGVLSGGESDTTAVKALLQERVAVAGEIDAVMKRQFEVGRATFAEVLESKRQLLNAKLDACETSGRRIEILHEFVKLAEQQQAVMEQMVAGGQASQVDGLKAKAYLLKVRIDLERAKGAK